MAVIGLNLNSATAQNCDTNDITIEGRWSEERINAWYADQPWMVGCNYLPANAINQIEMWQESTWSPEVIEKELDIAQGIGMNLLRVYLHDMVWADDAKGLYKRMDQFLDICEERGMRVCFVFFDDCHHAWPKLGEQPLPVRAYHNSGWVNSPARELALRYADGKATKAEIKDLKGYVQKTMKRFAKDPRVAMWEVYNEPGQGNSSGETNDANSFIGDGSNRLLLDSWRWAREVAPTQPITAPTNGCVGKRNIAINRANSDILSLHAYGTADEMRAMIADHQGDNRPVFVSEWLARNRNNVFESLPLMKEMNAANACWGFVAGKSGTIWPWSTRQKEGSREARNLREEREAGNVIKPGDTFPEPKVWHHDLFRIDGTPYDQKEIDVFKKLTKE